MKKIVIAFMLVFMLVGCSFSGDKLDESGKPPITVPDIPIDLDNFNAHLDRDLSSWIYIRFLNKSDCPILRYQLTLINEQGIESYLKCDTVVEPGEPSPTMKGQLITNTGTSVRDGVDFTTIKYTYKKANGRKVDVVYDVASDEYKLEPWEFSENDY